MMMMMMMLDHYNGEILCDSNTREKEREYDTYKNRMVVVVILDYVIIYATTFVSECDLYH